MEEENRRNKEKRQRERQNCESVDNFKKGKIRVLAATSALERGTIEQKKEKDIRKKRKKRQREREKEKEKRQRKETEKRDNTK